MRKVSKAIILGFCLCLLVLILFDAASAQVGTVTGVVLNRGNVPIPGLIMSLVHPVAGRSHPISTDSWGRFFFSNVPLKNDPYYLEIYWGRDLMYRNTVIVNGNINLGNIMLR